MEINIREIEVKKITHELKQLKKDLKHIIEEQATSSSILPKEPYLDILTRIDGLKGEIRSFKRYSYKEKTIEKYVKDLKKISQFVQEKLLGIDFENLVDRFGISLANWSNAVECDELEVCGLKQVCKDIREIDEEFPAAFYSEQDYPLLQARIDYIKELLELAEEKIEANVSEALSRTEEIAGFTTHIVGSTQFFNAKDLPEPERVQSASKKRVTTITDQLLLLESLKAELLEFTMEIGDTLPVFQAFEDKELMGTLIRLKYSTQITLLEQAIELLTLALYEHSDKMNTEEEINKNLKLALSAVGVTTDFTSVSSNLLTLSSEEMKEKIWSLVGQRQIEFSEYVSLRSKLEPFLNLGPAKEVEIIEDILAAIEKTFSTKIRKNIESFYLKSRAKDLLCMDSESNSRMTWEAKQELPKEMSPLKKTVFNLFCIAIQLSSDVLSLYHKMPTHDEPKAVPNKVDKPKMLAKATWNVVPRQKQVITEQVFSHVWSANTTSWLTSFFSPQSMFATTPTLHQQQIAENIQVANEEGTLTLKSIDKRLEELTEQSKQFQTSLKSEYSLFEHDKIKQENQIKRLIKKAPKKTSSLADVSEWTQQVEQAHENLDRLEQAANHLKESADRKKKNVQSLADLKAYIEAPTIETDDKKLLHAIGDVFGEGTGLVGASLQEMWSYRLNLLEAKLNTTTIPVEKEVYEKAIAKTKQALRISETLNRDASEKFIETLKAEVNQLSEGDSFFFQGGWTGIPGHGMAFEVIRQKDGAFAFRMYTSGAGGQYHYLHYNNFQPKNVQFVEKGDLSEESLLNSSFLHMLWLLSSFHRTNQVENWSEKELYEIVFPLLGGTTINREVPLEFIKNMQQSGTCSWLSLTAWFNYALAPGDVDRFLLEQQLKVLVDHFSAIDKDKISEAPKEIQKRMLLEKGVRSFSKEILEVYHQKGMVTADELDYILQKIMPIKHYLKRVENQLKLEAKQSAIPVSVILHEKSQAGDFRVERMSVEVHSVKSEKDNQMTFHLPDEIVNWAKEVKVITTSADESIDKNKTKSTTVALMDAFGKIDLGTFLEQVADLTPQQAQELGLALAKLSQQYMLCLFKQPLEDFSLTNAILPEQYLLQYKFLTMVHRLAEVEGTAFVMPLPSLLMSLSEQKTSFFRTYDAKLDHELQHILDYWKKRSPQKSDSKLPNQERVYRTEGENINCAEGEPDFVLNAMMSFLTPEKEKNLIAKFPELAHQDKLTKFIYLFSDKIKVDNKIQFVPRETLPASVYTLRDLFLQTAALNHYIKANEPRYRHIVGDFYTQHLGIKGPISKSLEIIAEKKDDTWRVEYEFYEYAIGFDTYSTRANNEKALRPFQARITDNVLFSYYVQKQDEYNLWYDWEGQFEINRQSPNQILVDRTKRDLLIQRGFSEGINEQIIKEIPWITSDSSLQIEKVIQFFERNDRLLSDVDYRIYLQLVLFDPGILLETLKASPDEAKRLIEYIDRFVAVQLEAFSKQSDFETVAELLQLNRRLSNYLKDAKLVLSDSLALVNDNPIPFRKNVAKEIINNPRISLEIKAIAARELALSYAKGTTTEDVMEMMKWSAYFESIPLVGTHKDVYAYQELMQALHSKQEIIKNVLTSKESGQQLTTILQTVHPDQLPQEWHNDYPLFSSSDGKWTIDVTKGRVRFNGASYVYLPREISESKGFSELFNQSVALQRVYKDSNGYYLKDKFGNDCLFLQDKENSGNYQFKIQRTIKNVKVVGVSEDLQEQCHVWSSVEGESPPQVFYTKKSDGVLFARGIGDHENPSVVKTILGVNEEGEDNGLELVPYQQGAIFTFLTKLDEPSWMRVWKRSDTDLVEKIEFPRLGSEPGLVLTVQTVDGEKRAYVNNPKGFYLTESQQLEALDFFNHYLLLQNDKGKKVVLGPIQKLKLASESSLIPASEIQHQKTSLAIYELSDNEVLQPQNIASRLYLAKIYLWHHYYEKASNYLAGFGGGLKGHMSALTALNQVGDALIEIVQLNQQNLDSDPRARAIRLKAGCLLIRDQIDFPRSSLPLPENLKLSELVSDYFAYLNLIEHAGGFVLTLNEELSLISQFKQYSILIARKAYLESGEAQNSAGNFFTFENINVRSPSEIPKASEYIRLLQSQPFSLGMEGVAHVLQKSQGVSSHFFDYYLLVRGELSSDKAKKIFKYLTGYEPKPGISWEETRRSLQLSLKYQYLSTFAHKESEATEKQLIWTLLVVLEYPGAFFSKEMFENKFSREFPKLSYENIPEEMSQFLDSHLFNRVLDFPIEFFGQEAKQLPFDAPHAVFHMRGEKGFEIEEEPSLSFQQSIALYPDKELKQPLITHLNDTLTINNVTVGASPSLEKAGEELNALLSLKTGELVADRFFETTKESINNYVKEAKKLTTTYELTSLEKLKDLKKHLSLRIAEADEPLKRKHEELLKRINRDYDDPIKTNEKQIKLLSGQEQLIDFDEIIVLFLKRDMQGFHRRNLALTGSEIAKINQDLQQYLIDATYQQQMKRLIVRINEIESTTNSEERKELVQGFAKMAQSKREYSVELHPEYLVFEYSMDILLYDSQVKHLDRLRIKNGVMENTKEIGLVFELPTGTGKTDVIGPLWAYLYAAYLSADGENLSTVVMTETMLSNVADKFAFRLGSSLSKEVKVIEFTRKTSQLQQELDNILKKLETTLKDRQVLLLTNDNIQTLFLKLIETQVLASRAIGEEKVHLQQSIETFRSIFRLFRQKAPLLIDEIDLVLDPRLEYYFTIFLEEIDLENSSTFAVKGNPLQVNEEHRQLCISLYRMLLTDPRWQMSMDFSPNDAPPFTSKLLSSHKQSIFNELLDKALLSNDPKIQEYFSRLKPEEKKLLSNFLNESDSSEADTFVSQQPSIIRRLLSLAREEVTVFLPLTFSHNYKEHYVLVENELFARPSKGIGNPQIKSRFGTAYEELNHTVQAHIKNGIPLNIVEKEWKELVHNHAQEMKIKHTRFEPKNSTAYKRLLILTHGDESFDLTDPATSLEKFKGAIDQSAEAKLDLIEKYILPEIKFFPIRISMGSQLYGWFFKVVSGITATPLDAEAFPRNIQLASETQTGGKTLTILQQNKHLPTYILPKPPQFSSDPTEAVEQRVAHIVSHIPDFKEFSGIIDLEGHFRNTPDNEMVMQAILKSPDLKEHTPPIEAGHFFDANSRSRVVESTKASIPALESKFDKEAKFYFLSQKETTGIDELFAVNAKFLLFLGKYSSLRDLLQAVGRLRGLGGQLPYFVICDEVLEVMKEVLNSLLPEPLGDKVEFHHILLFTAYNQAMKQADNNHRATIQELHSIVIEAYFEAVLDPLIPPNMLDEIFKDVEELFIKRVEDDPYEQFGKTKRIVKSSTVIDHECQKLIGSDEVQSLKKHPVMKRKEKVKNIDKTILDVAEKRKTLLSKEVKLADNYDKQVQVHTHSETNTQTDTQTNTQTQTNVQTDVTDNNSPYLGSAPKVHLWDPVRMFMKEYYLKLSTFDGFLSKYKGFYGSFKDVMCSENLRDDSTLSSYSPFNMLQKPIEGVLIVQDKDSGKLSPIFLDLNDVKQVKASLKENKKTPQKENDVRLCLISTSEKGTFNQGAEKIDIEALEADPQVILWKAQAKFINGVSDYSARELEQLENWILKNDVVKMHHLFTKVILKDKQLSADMYPFSPLDDLFKKRLH